MKALEKESNRRTSARISRKRKLQQEEREQLILDDSYRPVPGDLYGGAHYMQSSSADLTPQGRAIRNAAIKFGNGETLLFTPCKKGFIPVINGERQYACPLHDKARRKRIAKEKTFRKGEMDLNVYWSEILENGDSKKPEDETAATGKLSKEN